MSGLVAFMFFRQFIREKFNFWGQNSFYKYLVARSCVSVVTLKCSKFYILRLLKLMPSIAMCVRVLLVLALIVKYKTFLYHSCVQIHFNGGV